MHRSFSFIVGHQSHFVGGVCEPPWLRIARLGLSTWRGFMALGGDIGVLDPANSGTHIRLHGGGDSAAKLSRDIPPPDWARK